MVRNSRSRIFGIVGACARVFLQAFRDGLDQRAGDVGDERLDRAGLFADNLPRHAVEVLAPERLSAGQQFVRHRADREDVAAGVHRLPGDLLGRHVLRGADDHADHRHAGGFVAVGNPEVQESQHAGGLGDQQVGRLHVAVDDAALVRVTEAGAQLGEPVHLPRERHLIAAANHLCHRPPGDELHRQIRVALVFTHRVDTDDVWMMDARGEAGLAEEPPPGLLVGHLEDLDRDLAVEHRIEAQIHDPHAAVPEAIPHFIRSDVSRKLVHAGVPPYCKRSAPGQRTRNGGHESGTASRRVFFRRVPQR